MYLFSCWTLDLPHLYEFCPKFLRLFSIQEGINIFQYHMQAQLKCGTINQEKENILIWVIFKTTVFVQDTVKEIVKEIG